MVNLKIYVERCKGCGLCTDACPSNCLAMSERLNSSGYAYAMLLEGKKCTGCGLCYRMCPDMAIEIESDNG